MAKTVKKVTFIEEKSVLEECVDSLAAHSELLQNLADGLEDIQQRKLEEAEDFKDLMDRLSTLLNEFDVLIQDLRDFDDA